MAGRMGSERVTTLEPRGRRGRSRARDHPREGRRARATRRDGPHPQRREGRQAMTDTMVETRPSCSWSAATTRASSSASSSSTRSTSAPSSTFPLLHQVVTAQLAAKRSGTHSTKTRAEVAGGGAKPYRQKGTGRARQGTTRAPQFTGGGVAFGPKPRDYSQSTPRKMVRQALRAALSDRALEGRVCLVDRWSFEVPKTKQAAAPRSGPSASTATCSSSSAARTSSPSAPSATCRTSTSSRPASSPPMTSSCPTGSCSPTRPCRARSADAPEGAVAFSSARGRRPSRSRGRDLTGEDDAVEEAGRGDDARGRRPPTRSAEASRGRRGSDEAADGRGPRRATTPRRADDEEEDK